MGFGSAGFGGAFAPAAGAATAPTADAGDDQYQAGLTQVTLLGTGSSDGSTFAWTLTDPSGITKTSILSSATAESPTFHPISSSASAGVWTAQVTVTKNELSSKDAVNVRVGDAYGWVTLFPADAQQTSASQIAYGSASWGRTGDWTTMAIGAKGSGTPQYPKNCETKWYQLGAAWEDMTSMEFLVEADETYTQPTNANKVYVGAFMTTGSFELQPVIPGLTMTQGMFWISNRSETTKFSRRVDDQAFSFGLSSTGYNAARWVYVKDFYADSLDYVIYQKLDTTDPDNAAMSTGGTTTSPTGGDKIKIAMAIARAEADDDAVTVKFALKYRLKTRTP